MGKKAGKIELAWLHLRDAAPWEGIAFTALVLALVVFAAAAMSGRIDAPSGSGKTYDEDCVRYSFFASSC